MFSWFFQEFSVQNPFVNSRKTPKEMNICLENRELIKVKLQEGAILDPKETANEAAQILGAEFVQAIGRKFVLYRFSKERAKEGKQIVLPR